jgi:hypothetical protein
MFPGNHRTHPYQRVVKYLGSTLDCTQMLGSTLGSTWEVLGKYLGSTLDCSHILGSTLGSTWEVLGKYLGSTLGSTLEVPPKCIKIDFKFSEVLCNNPTKLQHCPL